VLNKLVMGAASTWIVHKHNTLSIISKTEFLKIFIPFPLALLSNLTPSTFN